MSTSAKAESTQRQRAEPVRVSVGIPQGLFGDPNSGQITGAVRRGGELVSLDESDYGLWNLFLTPASDATGMAEHLPGSGGDVDAIERLRKLGLLVEFERGAHPDGEIAHLRPIPLGVGLGKANGDSGGFEIQNTTLTLTSPVSLDAISIMFWWDMDGLNDLEALVAQATARLPGFPPAALRIAAVEIVVRLMAERLLYLDAPGARAGGEVS